MAKKQPKSKSRSTKKVNKKDQKTDKKKASSQVWEKSAGYLGIIPLGDRVLIEIRETEEPKSPSGIIIPDSINKERPEKGKVVAVGEGKMNEDGSISPMRVRVGDTVMFSKYGFDEIKSGEKEFIIVSESSILAIVK